MRAPVEILLDDDLYHGKGLEPTFIPGQTVSGRVIYTPVSQKEVEEVSISLTGRTHTVVRRPDLAGFGKDSYAENIELFRLRKTLFRGPFTMQATTTEWTFSFVLPDTTALMRGVGRGNWLYESEGHDLPPSMSAAGHGHKAGISYSLKVLINSDYLRGAETWNLPIAVINCSGESLPDPETTRCNLELSKVPILAAKPVIAEKVHLRERMGQVFRKPSVKHPLFPFHIEAHMPDCASITQALPISISAQSASVGKSQDGPPSLSLLGASLALIAKVHVRVATRMGDLDEKIWEELGQHTLVDTESRLSTNGEVIELSNSIRLADLVHEEVKQRITPSFKSYTVNRSYYLKLAIEVRDDGSNHTFHLEKRLPFLVLPVENPSHNVQAANVLLPSYNEEAGLSLPAYIEHATAES